MHDAARGKALLVAETSSCPSAFMSLALLLGCCCPGLCCDGQQTCSASQSVS